MKNVIVAVSNNVNCKNLLAITLATVVLMHDRRKAFNLRFSKEPKMHIPNSCSDFTISLKTPINLTHEEIILWRLPEALTTSLGYTFKDNVLYINTHPVMFIGTNTTLNPSREPMAVVHSIDLDTLKSPRIDISDVLWNFCEVEDMLGLIRATNLIHALGIDTTMFTDNASLIHLVRLAIENNSLIGREAYWRVLDCRVLLALLIRVDVSRHISDIKYIHDTGIDTLVKTIRN